MDHGKLTFNFACYVVTSPSVIRVLVIELIEVCYFVCSLYFRCASECCLHLCVEVCAHVIL